MTLIIITSSIVGFILGAVTVVITSILEDKNYNIWHDLRKHPFDIPNGKDKIVAKIGNSYVTTDSLESSEGITKWVYLKDLCESK